MSPGPAGTGIPYLDIVRTSGRLSGQTAQTLNTKFDDAWRFALGANYKLDEAWKLRSVSPTDQTPVPSANTASFRCLTMIGLVQRRLPVETGQGHGA